MRRIISPVTMIVAILWPIAQNRDTGGSTGNVATMTDAELQRALLKKLIEKTEKENKTDKWWHKWWEWMVPLIISILLSGVAFWFSWQTFSRDKRYKDIEFLGEIDKLLLEHPELGAYEDAKRKQYESSVEVTTPASIKVTGTEKLFFRNSFNCVVTALDKDVNVTIGSGSPQVVKAGSRLPVKGATGIELVVENDAKIDIPSGNNFSLQSLNDKLLDNKIDAFLYYNLNNFEMALNQPYDKSARDCWEEYLAWLYKKSTPFNKMIKDIVQSEYGDIYDQDFIKHIAVTLVKKGCDIQIPPSRKATWNIK